MGINKDLKAEICQSNMLIQANAIYQVKWFNSIQKGSFHNGL